MALEVQEVKSFKKLVNCATIKEIEKLKETIVGVHVRQAGDHEHPPGSPALNFKFLTGGPKSGFPV